MTTTNRSQRDREDRRQRDREERLRRDLGLEREADRIAAQFRVSCMSDTKWGRFLEVLEAFSGVQLRWKFVDGDRLHASGINVYAAGGRFGAFFGIGCFRHVEWVEIVTPDQPGLIEALDHAGQFDVERIEDGLRLYGYR